MGRVKDLWQDAQDALLEEYMAANPDADPEDAYDAVLPQISERMNDDYWDRVDRAYEEAKDRAIDDR